MATFDPYHKWLGIPPTERPINHYRLLGVALFESDPDVIDAATEQRVVYLRQCATGQHIAESQKLLNEVAAARLCLLNAQKKSLYDQQLRAAISPPKVVAAEDEFDLSKEFETPVVSSQSRRKRRTKSRSASSRLRWLIVAGPVLLVAAFLLSRFIPGDGQAIRPDEPSEVEQGVKPTDAEAFGLAKAKLEKSPEDRESQLVVGKYLWLYRGERESAIPHLESSHDPRWREIVVREQREPTSAAECLELGELWWRLGEDQSEGYRLRCRREAKYRYLWATRELSEARRAEILDRIAKTSGEPLKRDLRKGLIAQIFNGTDFQTHAVTRIDPEVAFNFGLGGPVAGVNNDAFSIRWQGFLRVPRTEKYDFVIGHDDGIRFWLDDKLLLDRWGGAGEQNFTLELVEGFHPIRLDYCERQVTAGIGLLWKWGDNAVAPISSEFLCHLPRDVARLQPPGSTPAEIPPAAKSKENTPNVPAKVGRFVGRGSVEIANSIDLLKLDRDFTIEVETKWNEASYHSFASNEAWPGMNQAVPVPGPCGWTLRVLPRNGHPELDFTLGRQPSDWVNLVSRVPKERREWTHAAATRSKDKLTLFLDGKALAVESVSNVNLTPSPTITYLGVRANGYSTHQNNCLIARFAMHQCDRFGKDAARGRFMIDDSTLVFFDFDHLEGGKLKDQTKKGHDGTILADVTVVDREDAAFIAPTAALVKAPDKSADTQVAGQERDDNRLKMKFCWCPAGTFMMGSPKNEPTRVDDEDQVSVTLTNGFWFGKFEVTQSEWQSVMETNIRQQQQKTKDTTFAGEGDRFPIYFVNRNEAQDFCEKLTDTERQAGRLPAGLVYRLPTEAEWEFACRAGTTTATSYGANLSSAQANFDGNFPYNGAAKAANRQTTVEVGSLPPNPWGLHEMHGNVQEWCLDAVKKLPGGNDPLVRNSTKGAQRVLRGGGWRSDGALCRSADRHWNKPDFRANDVGFRVVLGTEPP